MSEASPVMIRFGSFHGTLVSGRPEYTDALKLVFGVSLLPLTPDDEGTRRFELVVRNAPSGGPLMPAPDNTLALGGTAARPTVATEVLHAEVRLDLAPARVTVSVLPNALTFPALCVHFGVIVHKVLFAFDRLMLHAAAVRVEDEVCLFVGDKGAGKSTTSLALARAGGSVLGEDQVLLHRTAGGYLVSGSDARSRLTERTERHFFTQPLPVAPRDYAGTMKKEITMADYFRSDPYRDHRPTRLIFPKVTGRFELRPLRPQAALRRMLGYNGHFQRFEGARDQAAFLDFLAGFIAGVSCWDLSLSDDLSQLDALAGSLQRA